MVSYAIVDTNQTSFYGNSDTIGTPSQGSSFYGQDATYGGNQPSYTDNGDGTITDNVTGLMWTQTPINGVTLDESYSLADSDTTGGHTDWRLPSIKEIYSLMEFSGYTGASASASKPYIDTNYFNFSYGDTSAGERFIDAQYATTTYYVGKVFTNQDAIMGLNLADGRIKGYPYANKTFEAMFVRGNTAYGENAYVDNGDGTITDIATGLMWEQNDNGAGVDWAGALAYAEASTTAGYSDWRLPNAKELQSTIDYDRAPDATLNYQVGPAIDPIFNATLYTDMTATDPDYGWYWTGTTHVEGGTGNNGVYLSVGTADGVYPTLMDVHGAGAQRSDPKTGDADDYPAANANAPQGDVQRVYNYARSVRDATLETQAGDDHGNALTGTSFNDDITANGGDDTLSGGAMGDRIFGNAGADILYGNQGGDLLHGGKDNDTLYGGQGNDTLDGNAGDDRLEGGVGEDLYTFDDYSGNDTVIGFSSEDILRIAADINGTGIDNTGQVVDRVTVSGNDSVLDLGNGYTVTLEDFTGLTTSQVELI